MITPLLALYHSLRHDFIVSRYIKSGLIFGDAVSYLFMGKCIGFDKMEKRFSYWEKKYCDLGYEPIPLEDWELAGGYRGQEHLKDKLYKVTNGCKDDTNQGS